MGTKSNPGKFDCLAKLGPDEPFFVLRAQDKMAPFLVRQWVTRAERHAVNPEKIAEARAIATAMEQWPGRRVPD